MAAARTRNRDRTASGARRAPAVDPAAGFGPDDPSPEDTAIGDDYTPPSKKGRPDPAEALRLAYEDGKKHAKADARSSSRRGRVSATGGKVSGAATGAVNDGAGIILGLVGYALVAAYLRGGPREAKRWARAKFLNQTTEGRANVRIPGSRTGGGMVGGIVPKGGGASSGYVGAVQVASGPQPGTQALHRRLLGMFPGTRDLGIFSPRDVCGNHYPNIRCALSLHAEGRAGDIGVPVADNGSALGHQIAGYLETNAGELGIQEIIFARRRWTAGGGWKPYSGRSPHLDHVHYSQTPDAARSTR